MTAKPLALRAVEGGTPGQGAVSHRPMRDRVELGPILDVDEPAPEALGEFGRELWDSTVRDLIHLGLVTEPDRAAATALCFAWDRLRRAQKILDEEGYFTAGSKGQTVAHPAVRISTEALGLYLRYAREFGLTPSARVGLGLQDAARRTLQHDLDEKLGFNPRRTK